MKAYLKYRPNSAFLSAMVHKDRAAELERMATLLGVSRHRLIVLCLEAGMVRVSERLLEKQQPKEAA